MADRIQRVPDEPTDDRIKELADAFAEALLAADEVSAEIAVREAMDAEFSTPEIDEKLIAPALWLVGELWERGKISVAEEHLATEISVRMLALQREAQRVTRSRTGRRVMLATPLEEFHVVVLRMVENLLRGAGYDVMMLGDQAGKPELAPDHTKWPRREWCAPVSCGVCMLVVVYPQPGSSGVSVAQCLRSSERTSIC
jgi:methanogenic corrinoid protein MtbC1